MFFSSYLIKLMRILERPVGRVRLITDSGQSIGFAIAICVFVGYRFKSAGSVSFRHRPYRVCFRPRPAPVSLVCVCCLILICCARFTQSDRPRETVEKISLPFDEISTRKFPYLVSFFFKPICYQGDVFSPEMKEIDILFISNISTERPRGRFLRFGENVEPLSHSV